MAAAHDAQNVHSKLQTRASAASSGSDPEHFSHAFFMSSTTTMLERAGW